MMKNSAFKTRQLIKLHNIKQNYPSLYTAFPTTMKSSFESGSWNFLIMGVDVNQANSVYRLVPVATKDVGGKLPTAQEGKFLLSDELVVYGEYEYETTLETKNVISSDAISIVQAKVNDKVVDEFFAWKEKKDGNKNKKGFFGIGGTSAAFSTGKAIFELTDSEKKKLDNPDYEKVEFKGLKVGDVIYHVDGLSNAQMDYLGMTSKYSKGSGNGTNTTKNTQGKELSPTARNRILHPQVVCKIDYEKREVYTIPMSSRKAGTIPDRKLDYMMDTIKYFEGPREGSMLLPKKCVYRNEIYYRREDFKLLGGVDIKALFESMDAKIEKFAEVEIKSIMDQTKPGK